MTRTLITAMALAGLPAVALAHVDSAAHWHGSDALLVGLAMAAGVGAMLL